MKKRKSPWPVFAAIVLAIFIGTFTGKEMHLFGISFYAVYTLFGKLFINALTLIVVPLVSSSIITGIARIGSESGFGRIGIKMIGFYLFTSFLAVLIGLMLVNLIGPGHSLEGAERAALSGSELSALQQHVSQQESAGLSRILLEIVPSNILEALSQGNMLGIIFFSLLFGYAISKIDSLNSEVHMSFWKGIFDAMIYMTHIILKFLPFGVFCLVAKVFAETGLKSLSSVGLFSVTVLLGLMIFSLVALPLLLKLIGRVNPLTHFRAMMPALVTAFSTSSSSASLPVTLDCVEKRAGVSNRISSLVIPLGTSMNLSGSALYEVVAAFFVAQIYGLDLPFFKQCIFAFLTLIASMGVAGIPSGSLVAVIVILKAMGLPIAGIGLFIAVDRLLDMCRTTVNVFSDTCCAVLVARLEGETTVLTTTDFE